MLFFKKRSDLVLPKHVGKNFNVYNGKISKTILVTKDMVYYKFGSFFFTRKRGKDTKSKKLFFKGNSLMVECRFPKP